MKFLTSQLAYLLSARETRKSVGSLLRYLGFLAGVIALFTVAFHFVMLQAEGQRHTWFSGLYWVIVTMTTLGYGDIVFQTDWGRAYSAFVLLSGVVLLLIVLPFTFIRLFFAPWLEARIRYQVPRELPEDTRGHVILCGWDAIAPGLAQRLEVVGIRYAVIGPDAAQAARLRSEGVSAVTGEVDARETYERLRAANARLLLANLDDATNTNIVLTARELAPRLPIAATADAEESIDILELSGATHVLALKKQLGEMLVHRINTGHAQAHVIGSYRELQIAEFTVHKTGFAGKTIRETRLREVLGVSFIGVWERGRLLPAHPSTILSDQSVAVVAATAEQIQELDSLLVIYDTNYSPALVIGGGKVGRAAAQELRRREFPVHLVERDPAVCNAMSGVADQVFQGDAADRAVLAKAGIEQAPSVLLTTNDDAMNIYLAVYCRRLNPELRIVSRITHERNLEAIHRAGADFVLSYAALGIERIFSLVRGRDLVLLGEQLELFAVTAPSSLVGRTLAESQVGDRTGLNVIAIQHDGELIANPRGEVQVPDGAELVMLGNPEQLQRFKKAFGSA